MKKIAITNGNHIRRCSDVSRFPACPYYVKIIYKDEFWICQTQRRAWPLLADTICVHVIAYVPGKKLMRRNRCRTLEFRPAVVDIREQILRPQNRSTHKNSSFYYCFAANGWVTVITVCIHDER